jgi:hypothetical protein
MKLSKLLLAVIGASVLLGSLVASSSARTLSSNSNNLSATWSTMNFSGGFGTVECEVVLSGTNQSTNNKTVNAAIGSITAANVPACRRGGATILRETLPWTVTYRSFAGTLPNITAIATNVLGASFRMREPTFGATCLARSSAASPNIGTYNRNTTTGAITSVAASGTIPCLGALNVPGTISGTSTANSAVTVTLI